MAMDEWLLPGEKISYDTKSNNLKIVKEDQYVGVVFRGIVTDKRAIFISENTILDVSKAPIARIDFKRDIYYWLLVIGILLPAASGVLLYYVFYYGESIPVPQDYLMISAYAGIAAGIVLIIVFIFVRPEMLIIYSAGKETHLAGPKETLMIIMKELRNQF